MSYEIYKVLHVSSILAVFMGLGGLTYFVLDGKRKEAQGSRRFFAMIHGIALAVALVSGFGLIARLGLAWSPVNWLGAKTVLWLLVGSLPVVARRRGYPKHWLVVFLLLGVLGSVLAVGQPF